MQRKIVTIFLAAVMSAALAACAEHSEKAYEAQLESWMGKSEKELVMAWGIPDKQYQLDPDTRMLSFVARNTVYYPGTFSACVGGASSNFGLTNCYGGFPPSAQTYHCETIFTLHNGRVAKWGHRGNDCRA